MATPAAKVLPPIIQDEMQKRRMMKKATTVAKFQTRLFVLYKHQLAYKSKDGKHTRGSISVMGIKICEDVEECAFNRPHVFQVGYLEKGKMFHLYIQARDHSMREIWKFHIRKLCTTYNDHRMQQQYHGGHYKKDRWSCCANNDKNNVGCRQAYNYDGPQPLGEERRPTLAFTTDSMNRHKTPVLHRSEPKHRVKMPSDCYDSDDFELSDVLPSASPSPVDADRLFIGNPVRKSGAGLSSHSMRYTSRPVVVSRARPEYEISDIDSGSDVGVSLSTSTPYYCPMNTGSGKDRLNTITSRHSSTSAIPSIEKFDLLSLSSTSGVAGSERFDSLSALTHTSRLDSRGSSFCSSMCDSMSIPRTSSDYQRRIEEEGEGGSGPVYTSPGISVEDSVSSIAREDSVSSTLEFEMEHQKVGRTQSSLSTESGVYVNI